MGLVEGEYEESSRGDTLISRRDLHHKSKPVVCLNGIPESAGVTPSLLWKLCGFATWHAHEDSTPAQRSHRIANHNQTGKQQTTSYSIHTATVSPRTYMTVSSQFHTDNPQAKKKGVEFSHLKLHESPQFDSRKYEKNCADLCWAFLKKETRARDNNDIILETG